MPSRHVALVALVLGLAVTAFIVARALTERDARRDSEHRAEVAAAQIRDRIEEAASLTGSLRRYMLDTAATGVTNDQFTKNASSGSVRAASRPPHGPSRFMRGTAGRMSGAPAGRS